MAERATDPKNLIWVMPAEGFVDLRPPDIVVIAGGDVVDPSVVADVDPAACVLIAADSGLDVATAIGWADDVDVVVGDFDSVSRQALDRAAARGADVRAHDADKDWTDLELALSVATEHSTADRPQVLVVGVTGGRRDHEFANLLLLAAPAFARLDITWRSDGGAGWVARGRLAIPVIPQATVSVLPVHGPATVTLDGFNWPLDERVIEPGSTLGVSNLAVVDQPVVTVHDGVVLVFAPPARSPHSTLPVRP